MHKIATIETGMGELIKCVSPEGLAIHIGDRCVYEAEQLLEIGVINAVVDGRPDAPDASLPKIIRCATLQDQAKARENDLMSKMAMDSCEVKISELKLDMRLVQVHFSFDRKHLTVLFSAEERVDFRELIKQLSTEHNTRVEMRQIGVRDEAAMIGGLGPCGREQCCCSWLQRFESINVKMAKTQRISLNPTTISGMCGRLKCCLRYENDQYRECSRGMPRDGALVEGPDGGGMVIDQNIMARQVRVRLEDERILDYDVDDLRILRSGRRR
jgi:cell fate regulator YaaT (PSP1 superfamily)